MIKHLLVRALTLFAFAHVSLTTQAASLQTPENIPLSSPAAIIAAGGIPGSTNLAGTNFIMSAVTPATAYGGSASLVNAQQWVSRFTNAVSWEESASYAMALRPDGGVVVTGYSQGTTNGFNFLTLCYAADGTLLWTNFYDGPGHGDDTAYGLAVGTNGDVWVAGNSMRYATNDVLTDAVLIRYASNGIPLWTNRYTSSSTNGDSTGGVVVDGAGNAYINVSSAYWTDSFGRPDADAILKFDPLGNLVWSNIFLAAAPDSGQALHDGQVVGVDPAGNLYIAGYTGTENYHTSNALVKLAGDGTPLWTNFQTIDFLSQMAGLQFNRQGDAIITHEGWTNYMLTNDRVEYVVMKYSGATGEPLWTNFMLGASYYGGDVPQTLVTPAGDVLLVGGAAGAADTGLYQVVKFNSNGVPIWTNLNANLGTTNSEIYPAAVDNAGNLYLASNAPDPTNNSEDFITMKLSSSGQPVWTNFYDGPAGSEDDALAMVVNGMGEVFVTGQSDGSNSPFQSTTVAYADVLTYVPPTDFTGLDTINYTLTDAFGTSTAGSVQVLVTGTTFKLVPLGFGLSGFQLTVEGAPGTNMVIIQASTDLVHWKPLSTNAPIKGSVQYLDTSAAGFAQRFYRAEQLP